MSANNEYTYKILFIGNFGVGKSSILQRFADDKFDEAATSVLGVDFKTIRIEQEDTIINLQIWDTAGLERFGSMNSRYYSGAHGLIIVYDVTNQDSFDDVQKWIEESKRYVGGEVKKILIGNKFDLESHRAIEYSKAKAYADSLGIPLLETSAKTASNIEEIFISLLTSITN